MDYLLSEEIYIDWFTFNKDFHKNIKSSQKRAPKKKLTFGTQSVITKTVIVSADVPPHSNYYTRYMVGNKKWMQKLLRSYFLERPTVWKVLNYISAAGNNWKLL